MDIITTDTEVRPTGEWRREGKRPFTQGNTGTLAHWGDYFGGNGNNLIFAIGVAVQP